MPNGKIQMTLIQIDNYGPWTLCLGHKRESDLQILQSELYADLQRLFSIKGGLVFYTRFDNMLAVTNGIDVGEHMEIQESICHRYPITISMGIGVGTTAMEAQVKATESLQRFGSSQLAKRRKVLATFNKPLSRGSVQIAHIDVNNVTKTLTDRTSAYEALFTILKVYNELVRCFLKKEALVFYAGGDNFIAPSNTLTKQDYMDILRRVSEKVGLELKAGVGIASNAVEALKLADEALDIIRRSGLEGPVHVLLRED
jgi:GTP cyclohydrolase IIa